MSAALESLLRSVREFEPTEITGRVLRLASTHIEADGPDAPIGALCAIEAGATDTLATVTAVDTLRTVLSPFGRPRGIQLGARVRLVSPSAATRIGEGFLGRAVDALGRPIDGRIAPSAELARPAMIPPLDRVTLRDPVITGIRAIDGLTPLAKGQRIGVFAAPGVGKTTLLSQLAAQVEADVCVLCLVGERGREVEGLWSGLATSARARCVMVAATSDEAAAMRVQAVEQALALAEDWRQQGRHVLFLLDSATRYAMALREIGLAAGEPPTVRAYTPGVFAALPRLVERCGANRKGGAITAVMTVLSETDDIDDPIVEVMKSLLDGHILLSRRIAEQGRYPAIDAPRSISRLAEGVMSAQHQRLARRARALMSAHEAAHTLIDAGVYVPGSNPETDEAVSRRPALEAFMAQDIGDVSTQRATLSALEQALEDRRDPA